MERSIALCHIVPPMAVFDDSSSLLIRLTGFGARAIALDAALQPLLVEV